LLCESKFFLVECFCINWHCSSFLLSFVWVNCSLFYIWTNCTLANKNCCRPSIVR
jgi:hypothetical protein